VASDGLVVDLIQIRTNAEAKRDENLAFCRHLHDHHHPIEEFQQIAGEVVKEIDCTACANCCRETVVTLGPEEIAAIAGYLGISAELALRQFTRPDPEDSASRVLKQGQNGCVFLDGNLCLIYEVRPEACRAFPHVGPGRHSLGARLSSLYRRGWICPIVYNAFEQYKQRLGFPRTAPPLVR
jgi:uncharacterized protein